MSEGLRQRGRKAPAPTESSNRTASEVADAIADFADDSEGSGGWYLRELPLRLQQFVDIASRDISSRIFRDLVIRVPIGGATKDEVIALCEPYGNVQYIQQASLTGKAKQVEGSGSGLSLGGDELDPTANSSICHYVKFDDGLDAIRCFFHLNGAIVDPKKCHDEQTQLYEAIAKEAARQGDDMAESDKELADMVAQSLKPGELMRNCDPSNRFIVIGVDFFRLSVLSGATSTARSTLLSNTRRAAADFNALQRYLQRQAASLDKLVPIVQSHEIEWRDFIFAVNYLMFLHATPSNEPWETCMKALPSMQFKARRLLMWIDQCQGETELLSGAPRLNRGNTRRSLWPLSPQAQLFLAILVLMGLLVLWLRYSSLI